MYARVATISGDHIEQVVKFLEENNTKDKKGYKGGYVLTDHNKQKTMTVTLWKSKETLDDSFPEAKKILDQISKDITGMPIEIEVYEVAAKAKK